MGRRREEKDLDRFLSNRNGNYLYKRRVPKECLDLDERAPTIRIALGTDDLAKARSLRDIHEKADNELWGSLIDGSTGEAAKARYRAAIARAAVLGFTYRPASEIAAQESVDTILRRIESVIADKTPRAAVEAVLGAAGGSDQAISTALEFYFETIVPDELRGKSADQKRRWKNKRRASVSNFVAVAGDLKMSEIDREAGHKIHTFWMKRVAPEKGAPTHSANFANQQMSHLRGIYRDWFVYMGVKDRPNPFDGLSFADGASRPRVPFSTAWIKDRILRPSPLARINAEARGIFLAMVETGARPSELCNLKPAEIRLDVSVPHISVAPSVDPEDPREIKTTSSVRLIPLVGVALAVFRKHPEGFPRYHDRGSSLSAVLNKQLRAAGLAETDRHTAYSLRHSFEDRMKEAHFDEELRRILMGHAIDRPKYGSGGSLEWRQGQLQRITLPFDPAIV